MMIEQVLRLHMKIVLGQKRQMTHRMTGQVGQNHMTKRLERLNRKKAELEQKVPVTHSLVGLVQRTHSWAGQGQKTHS